MGSERESIGAVRLYRMSPQRYDAAVGCAG